MDASPDERLVEEARQGSAEAFSELVRRHQRKVHRICHAMTRNASDADDLAQEVFLAAYRSLPSFNRKARFSTWLYRISVNTTLSFLKKRAREKDRTEFREDMADADRVSAAADSPEETSVRRELEVRMEEALGTLPPPFRTAFLLVAGRGMSHAEAAEVLGCSENTVSWRLHKARKLVRARLEPYLGRSGHEM